ncbi:hypothetical protein CONCODRAFT_1971 [Conidiobolus coronatus NRRL 28638]|uniref:Uncharacterized protein n=1 Tax=Conidiobolus coronatus (strain ATCC 28846 / CBS 209.66 / NRRL 28638) TaxID=796925 RepID=A0A137PIV3_CONC2|nr:hypothetical protein CONCODRAFT_1971 [Conidiobolus coronatus NRRL 28638]|eukprot:KXN74900.1 hypothetical protein CONCODRAFT_1971 [Conidiobolus coronatus NRRL 28638]
MNLNNQTPNTLATSEASFSPSPFQADSSQINLKPQQQQKSPLKFKRIAIVLFFYLRHLVIETMLPMSLFYNLTPNLGALYAMLISASFPAISVLFTIIVSRRFEPIPILIVSLIVIGYLLSLTGDPKLIQLNTPIANTILTISYLATINCELPLIHYFARPWLTLNNAEAIKKFDAQQRLIQFREINRFVTYIWAAGLISLSIIISILVFTVELWLLNILCPLIINLGILGLVLWTGWYCGSKARIIIASGELGLDNC